MIIRCLCFNRFCDLVIAIHGQAVRLFVDDTFSDGKMSVNSLTCQITNEGNEGILCWRGHVVVMDN